MGIAVSVAAWWAFRPEKLFINQKVNEAAPAALSLEPEALYTGKLEGKVHHTSGRATVYKTAEGQEYLRLSDFHDIDWAGCACASGAGGGPGA